MADPICRLPALRFFHKRMPRYIQKNPHFTKLHHDSRSAVAEKGKADAGVWNGIGNDRDIERRLQANLYSDACRQHKSETVRRF